MEEVAAERWGSLDKLEKLLADAENKARENRFDTRQPKWKKEYRRESFRDGNRNTKFDQFKKDKSDAYESYKKQFKKTDESVESYNRNFTSTSEPKFTKSAPKWMKKEFHNKYQVDSKETDKNNDNSMKKECSPEETRKESSLLTDKEMNELGAKLLKAEMLGNLEEVEKLESKLEGARKAKEEASSPKEVPLLTDREMNELGAKLIKAELLGNMEEVKKLKLKLAEARKVKENASNQVEGKSDETVLLVKTDNRGFTQPISTSQSTYTGKKKKQVDTYDAGGKRTCYFPDDDKYSLKQMFEKERKTTIDDQNAEFARLFAKQSKNDDDESFLVEAAKIKPQIKQEYRDRSQAIHEHMRRSSALGKCQFCLDSSHMKKHLIVSLGKTVYLSLPGCQSLVDYHCYIVPMAHVTSGTLLDEDVWSEIQTLKKCLIKMFDEMDKTVIFMETSVHHRWHPHCFIECIPVPKEDGDMAPMYFKKAIMESETEWSLNKKLIDLYKKDLLHSVPKGLPYFSVEFGTSGGFAHVVEDEKLFPSYFGKEVIGGILDVEPVRWRKPPREPFENQSKKVLEFTQLWKKYDLLQKQ
ncbi:CWF19-like protein 2 isoform X2 [Centruroides sculpturatus]|uniref:CWF19-like protein 2 isoform X1 n=1 Tax=Centruroides sculpturatus TaxID=218467 RepID=UPI000C6D09E4|nr:CWF19-like protein 2 isoform X1 [Centruroides sculpturatus]XP_023242679.1 CWF19-like protein 2 isoform X2 [Centruroides sculpturatus]